MMSVATPITRLTTSFLVVSLMSVVHHNHETSETDAHGQSAYMWRLDTSSNVIRPTEVVRDIFVENTAAGINKIDSESNKTDVAYNNAMIDGLNKSTIVVSYDRLTEEQKVFDIVTSTIFNSDGTWHKTADHESRRWRRACVSNHSPKDVPSSGVIHYDCKYPKVRHEVDHGDKDVKSELQNKTKVKFNESEDNVDLGCGMSVNFTLYDHLVGVQNRFKHPPVRHNFEDIANLFNDDLLASVSSRITSVNNGDIATKIELYLKQLKRNAAPNSAIMNIQSANYWRIRGHPLQAIECLRRVLAGFPNDPSALLNLGHLLFHLHYVDDALFLTKMSLDIVLAVAANSHEAVMSRGSASSGGAAHGAGDGNRGDDFSSQPSRLVSPATASEIVVMDSDEHEQLLLSLQPDSADELELLDSFGLSADTVYDQKHRKSGQRRPESSALPSHWNPWRHHLQMGQILAEYSQHQEAALHLRQAIHLKPDCTAAKIALARLDVGRDVSVHIVTIAIIFTLISTVIYWLITTLRNDVTLHRLNAASNGTYTSRSSGSGQSKSVQYNRHNNSGGHRNKNKLARRL